MDDLSAILNRVLSDPESMRQLEEAAASLGLIGDGQKAAAAQQNQASPFRPVNRGMPGRRNTYPNKPPTPTRLNEEELAEVRRLLEQLVKSGGKAAPPPPQPSYQPPPQPQDNVPDIDVGALSDLIASLTGKPRQAPDPAPATPEGGGLDLSALSGILSGLGGGQQNQNQTNQQAPDLSSLLSGLGQGQPSQPQGGNLDLNALLNNLTRQAQPQPQQQQAPDLSSLLAGLAGQSQQQKQPSENLDFNSLLNSLSGQPQPQQQAPDLASLLSGLTGQGQQNNSGADLSGLSSLLGNLGGGGNQGNVDLSGLQGILSGLTGGGAKPNSTSSTVSTLANMLGGGGNDAGPMPGMDMGMLMKFQQAMSSISANAGNVRLLMALKSHLKDEARREKVDDAIKVMQVIQFLPLLKESGIFGKLEEILDSFNLGGILGGRRSGGQGQSGLGNLFGRNSGLGSLLSSLTGGR